MHYIQTEIDGVWLIEPKIHKDSRGYFFESYRKEQFAENIGAVDFVQENEALVHPLNPREVCFMKNV